MAGAVAGVEPKAGPETLPNWKGELAGLSCASVVAGTVPKRLLDWGVEVEVAPKELGDGAVVVGALKRLWEGADVARLP